MYADSGLLVGFGVVAGVGMAVFIIRFRIVIKVKGLVLRLEDNTISGQ